MNQELPDIQAGFRKGRATRDQIANIHWIIEKARELKKKKKIIGWEIHGERSLVGHSPQSLKESTTT